MERTNYWKAIVTHNTTVVKTTMEFNDPIELVKTILEECETEERQEYCPECVCFDDDEKNRD